MTRLDLSLMNRRDTTHASLEKAMIIHDIRGALGGVIGGLALLDRNRIDPSLHPQVERIMAAAEALGFLLESAIAEGEPLPDPGPELDHAVEIAWLIRFAERRWAGEAAARGLSFLVEAGPDLPERVLAGSVDLCRILANLIGNALKFSEAGQVVLALSRSMNGDLVMTVRDQGPGLGACDVTRLFEFGYRAPGGDLGEGIGLHVAKQLADRMGARLNITERPEGGVDASLILPDRLCIDRPGGLDEEQPLRADLSGRRILLAEDNPTNQMVAREMLTSLGAEVTAASDGVEALDMFQRQEFDLLVIDIEMPRLSGLDVIRAIRDRGDRKSRTPIVALTAYALKEHRLRIAEAGADGLISKPIVSTETFGQAIVPHLRDCLGSADEPEPDDLPQIDTTIYAALQDAIGQEVMVEVLDRVVADLEAVRLSLEGALAVGDAAQIRTQSHILISVAGAFGASRLRARAAKLNVAAHGERPDDLAAPTRACLAEISPALDFVRAQRARC